jgi:drug/metabolite transporter (DMT)-like permease
MAVASNTKPGFRPKVIGAFAAVYLIWGSTYLAIRFTLETMPPFLSAGLRFLVAGLVLYFFDRLKNKEKISSKHWLSAVTIGGFLLLGGNGCVVLAERYVPSGLAALFIAVVPLWMVLLEWRWHRTKRPPLGVFLGIGIGFLGVWLLMAPDFLHLQHQIIHLGGALLLLLASLSWSIGSVYSRKATLPKSPFLSTGMEMIGGGGLLLLLGLLGGEYPHFHLAAFSFKSMAALLYLAVFGSLLAFTAYIWLLKNVGVARTSTYAFVNPVVAIFLGFVFADERLETQTALAALLVLVAVIVITFYYRES